MERIEGCIANAEHDDEHKTLIDARDKINAQAAEIEALEAQLKTVLDREAETHRRHDAKIEAQAAESERLRGIVAVWLDLAIGPDEKGDYYRQKQVIKASQEALGDKE